MMDLYNTLWVK
ncbi:hypothetical protein VCHENC02_3167A, partial [Vibrio harveyi]